MRISLVTETFPPEVNGVAMTLSRLAKGLSERGHQLTVVRPRQSKDAKAEREFAEYEVRGFPIPLYPELKLGCPSFFKLRSLWRRQQPDFVHVATEGPLGFSAVVTAQMLGIPIVSSFHTNFHSYSTHYGAGFMKASVAWYLRFLHNRALRTFAPSEDIRVMLEKHGFRDVVVSGRGVDLDLFRPEARSEDLRQAWGAGPDDPVVMYVGRVANEKNLPLTLKAFKMFKEVHPSAKLVVVGDGPLREDLQSDHGDVIFAGMRHGKMLAAHYASADIFMFGSVTETFGNVVTEAMASGLVVLCYDYAAGQRHIAHEVSGFLAPLGDEAAFLQTARRIAMEKDRWPEISRAAVDAMQPHSWSRIVEQYETELRGLRERTVEPSPA